MNRFVTCTLLLFPLWIFSPLFWQILFNVLKFFWPFEPFILGFCCLIGGMTTFVGLFIAAINCSCAVIGGCTSFEEMRDSF